MLSKLNLEDAEACLNRAQAHLNEFRQATRQENLWKLIEGQDSVTGEWFKCLCIDKMRLVAAKPILADSATNIISALDHVAASIARANGHGRLCWLHYPLGLSETDFVKATRKTKGKCKNTGSKIDALGPEMLRVIASVRQSFSMNLGHVETARCISNDGKHWEFRSAEGKAVAVKVVPAPPDRLFHFPRDAFDHADRFEFYRSFEPPQPFQRIVVKLEVVGLRDGLPTEPVTILECSMRFVRGVIEAVSSAAAHA